jgi:predicted fused transcriptional regulator/phosphomethylpyrimidine kinase
MSFKAILIPQNKSIYLKKAIARKLYSDGYDQSNISRILALSQPMVSNYCNSKELIPKEINHMAKTLVDKIIIDQDISFQTCICFTNNVIEGDCFIAKKNEIISRENNYIINNLTDAFIKLKDKDISLLIPKVKINIAMAKINSKSSEDIASFINGLTIADNKITSFNGIGFGKSKHLSSLLLKIQNPYHINAIMNLAYINNIDKTKFNFTYLPKDFNINKKINDIDILLHKGDYGIEPCTYVLGSNAVDIANKVLKILENIK